MVKRNENAAVLNDAVVNVNAAGHTSVKVTSAERVVVKVKNEKIKQQVDYDVISQGQRAEMHKLVMEWVHTAALAGRPILPQAANAALNRQAKSVGKCGVTSRDYYPACDFERGKKFLVDRIRELRNTRNFEEKDPDGAFNRALAEIHVKLKQKGITEDQYREYLAAEFGVSSAKELDLGQLLKLRDYLRSGGRCLLPKPKEKSIFELRCEALKRLMALRGGETFTSVDEAWKALRLNDFTLFNVSSETFTSFWKKQKIVKLKRGRKVSAKELP
jgi:hypothetical protein